MQKQEFEEMVGQRVSTEFYNVVEKLYMRESFLCGHDFVQHVFDDAYAKTWEGADLAGESLDIKLAEYLRGLWIYDNQVKLDNYTDHTDADRKQIRKDFRKYTKALLHIDSNTASEVARLIA